MKKLFVVMVLMIFTLATLVACSDNGDTQGTLGQEPIQTQNATPSVGGTINGHAREIPDFYYSVGDIVDLWGSWELVIHEGVRVEAAISENPPAFLDARDGIRERAREIKEAGILLIPATLTRTGAQDQAGRRDGVAWLHTPLSVYGPNGQVMDGHNILSVDEQILWGMRRDSLHEIYPPPAIGTELLPNESQQGYIFAIFDGNGDYLIQIRSGHSATYIVVPVSRN